MQTYTTTERYAEAHGLAVTEVRALARKGLILGAIRVGGPRSSWAIPADAVILTDVSQRSADTAARGSEDSRAAADTRPNRADRPKDMSTGDTPTQIARRVENRVRNVTTRPARALAVVLFLAADIASLHTKDRDARCTRCGWTYPCPDRRALDQLLHVADLIKDGDR